MSAPKLTEAQRAIVVAADENGVGWARAQLASSLYRTIRAVSEVQRDESGSYTAVQLSCGHVLKLNPIYSYRVGEDHRCLSCVDETLTDAGRAALKEGGK